MLRTRRKNKWADWEPETPFQRTDKGAEWDAETARLVDWFLATEPPTEPFELYPHVHVARPA